MKKKKGFPMYVAYQVIPCNSRVLFAHSSPLLSTPLGSAVVRQEIGAGDSGTDNHILGRQDLDSGGGGSGRDNQLLGLEVQSQTGDVGTGHASAAHGGGGRLASDAEAGDGETGRKDVDHLAVVGEAGAVVVLVDGADGKSAGGRARRGETGVDVAVARSSYHENALLIGGVDGGVEGSGLAAAERQGDDGLGSAAGGVGDVGDGPHEAVENDIGGRARSVENLHSHDLGLLGNAISLARDDAGAVRSVAICVGHLGVGDGVVAREGPALKFGVGSVDAGVDDVGPGALAGTALVDVLTVAGLAVRDRPKPPGGCGLGDFGGVDRDGADGLDGEDLVAVFDLLDGFGIELAGISLPGIGPHLVDAPLVGTGTTAAQAARVDVLDPAEVVIQVGGIDVGVHDDDILALDNIAVGMLGEGRPRQHSGQGGEEEEQRIHVELK